MAGLAGRVVGAALILVGLIWAGQGLGLIGGSFMTGRPQWLVIGAIVALAGVVVLVRTWRGRSH